MNRSIDGVADARPVIEIEQRSDYLDTMTKLRSK